VLVGKVQRLLFEEQVQMEAVAEAMEEAHLKRERRCGQRFVQRPTTNAAVTAEGETMRCSATRCKRW